MTLGGRWESLILFLGDLVFFTLSLWLTLLLRYGVLPTAELFYTHLVPFSLLFLIWTVVYFIYDLYRRQTAVFEHDLPARIFSAQLVNSLLAALAFYFIPYFSQIGLTPKTNLLIYLLLSSALVLLWRRFLAPLVYRTRRATLRFDCEGPEVEELKREIIRSPNHNLRLVKERPAVIVINRYDQSSDDQVAELYRMMFRGARFVSVQDLYEEIFGRVPLSLVNERWFLARVSTRSSLFYDLLKRGMDLFVSGILAAVSLFVYPFIIVAIKLDDGGPIFYWDRRVGRYGRDIAIAKFRTMSREAELSERRVTRTGKVLRRTRLDEVPQLWSVIRGQQSLIGPRPEKHDYVELYRERIPFYDARHLIAPGLSGWAQIYHDNHPHFSLAEDATREKLSYDLYYVKNRSLWLDITIALKTIKTLLSRSGR